MSGPNAHVPTLTDRTVTLRARGEQDLDDIVEACRDPESVRWTRVPDPYSLDDAKRFVKQFSPAGWEQNASWGFAIEAHDPVAGRRRFAGNCDLRNLGEGRAEIAYLAHPWARGTGVMERALRLLLGWGFAERDLKMVIWYAHVGNWASRRLAWKVGFTHRGMIPAWSDQHGELFDTWTGTLLAGQPMSPATTWLETPVVLGEKVTLRPLTDSDVPRVVEACNDEKTRHWLAAMPSPYQEADARTWIEECREGAAVGNKVTWAIADRDSGRLIGAINLFDVQVERVGEVGYWVHPDARGRGVATEATRLALRHGFIPVEDGGLGLSVIRAHAALENLASQRVLTAAGMTHGGTKRRATVLHGGIRVDAALFDCIPEEFSAR